MEKHKKNQGCFTLKCSVVISYLISIISNILLTITLFLSEHHYRWFGFMFHSLIVFFSIISLKNLIIFSNKNLLRYRNSTRYYSLFLLITVLYYFSLITYNIYTDTDIDLIYFFSFCIIIWSIFHYLFVTIINSFIKALEDRPAQTGSINLIDKNLRDLMINSSDNRY